MNIAAEASIEGAQEISKPIPKPSLEIELSLNTLVGITKPRTMKVQGYLGAREVVVLIDSGASHNFILWNVAQALKMSVTTTEGYGFMMGTGQSISGNEI